MPTRGPTHVLAEAPPRQATRYGFHVSRPLPTVNLSHTLVGYLRPAWQARLTAFMASHYRKLIFLHRLASLAYFLLLVLPPSGFRHAITVLVFCSILTLTCTSFFLSLDILGLLLRSHEAVFISTISLINWSCLAFMLGDFRVMVCFPSWYSAQVGIIMDANFRTFPSMLRSTMVSIPAVLSVALCCALDKIYEPMRRVVTIGPRTLPLANIIVFASTTLAIFLAKKVFLKLKRTTVSRTGHNIIPCVIVRARLELCAEGRVAYPPPAMTMTTTSYRNVLLPERPLPPARPQPLQTLRLSETLDASLDVTNCLLHTTTSRLTWYWLVPLYVTGISGFACLVLRSALGVSIGSRGEASEQAYTTFLFVGSVLSYAALACTVLFCGTLTLHFQRDLVRMLLRNFDYAFSSVQVVAMTVCLCDLFPHSPADRASFAAWAVWYQWMLTLDALTPPMKAKFRFRKRFAAPVVVAFLAGGTWLLLQIFLDKDIDLSNRVLLEYKVSTRQTFRLTTLSVLVERLVTILGWLGSRLLHELAVANEHELLFLRGLVEYASAFETFPRLTKKTRVETEVARVETKGRH